MFRNLSKSPGHTSVSNEILHDDRLSWEAVGIACYLISRPDGYEFLIEDLVAQANGSITAVRTAITELRVAGYLETDENANTITVKDSRS